MIFEIGDIVKTEDGINHIIIKILDPPDTPEYEIRYELADLDSIEGNNAMKIGMLKYINKELSKDGIN